MKDKLRKKYQSGLRHIVKDLNKNIENDDLWNGRFVFHIIASELEKFEDGSGGLLHSIIRCYDKANGYYKDYIYVYAPYLHNCHFNIWEIGSKFITEDTDAWKHGHNPYKEKADYKKVKVDNRVWDLRYTNYNFYISL